MEEKLIEEVKNHPCIYDKSATLHKKNKAAKEKAWESIAESVGVSVEKCKIRWKSLRDKFVHHSLGAPYKEPKWPYFNQMQFLKDFVIRRKYTENFCDSIVKHKKKKIFVKVSDDNDDDDMDYEEDLWFPSTGKQEEEEEEREEEEEQQQQRQQRQQEQHQPQKHYYKPNTSQKRTLNNSESKGNKRISLKRQNPEVDYVSEILEKIDNYIDFKVQNTTQNVKTQKHESFLKILEEYLNKIDENEIDDFKFEIIRFTHMKYHEIKFKNE